MRTFNVLTIFPELISSYLEIGILGRATSAGKIAIGTTQLREFSDNPQNNVDDTPFGGGSGMVLSATPAIAALKKAKQDLPNSVSISFSPRGKPLTQELAKELCNTEKDFILLSSRYEGVDQRVIESEIDLEVSLGDFVLMGGELPALCFIETISRLIPEVLGNPESLKSESFNDALLDYPQYTKPREISGMQVPEVLTSGHHAEIESWRTEQRIKETVKRRPDLITKNKQPTAPTYLALIHHPVRDKNGDIITSSLTNLDIHDIARSSCTFGIKNYFIVHPVKAMKDLAGVILGHWSEGYGSTYNPNRSEALDLIKLVNDLDEVISTIENKHSERPVIVSTSAIPSDSVTSFEEGRARLCTSTKPHLILLGTGWGLAESVLQQADFQLEPINGYTNYNHLSVRGAAAIILDRLLGN